MRKLSHAALALLCLAVLIATGVAHADPIVLNPPPGQCFRGFPIQLNTGSYILGTNFTVNCSEDAFDIVGNNVTLDLGGYSIIGKEGSNGSGIGVSGAKHSNVTVKNGSILNMPGGGIALGLGATVTDVAVLGTGGVGISVGSGTVRHVHSDQNGNDGIDSLDEETPATIEDSDASGNDGYGIYAFNALISNNTIINNHELGIFCAVCTVEKNTVEGNGEGMGAGIVTFSAQVTNNTVVFNKGDAIVTPNFGDEIFTPSSVVGNTIGENEGLGLDATGPLTSFGTNLFFLNDEETAGHTAQTSGGVMISPNACDGNVVFNNGPC